MDRPEVWMSDLRTPCDVSAAMTRLAAWLASMSAVDTDDALVCTPIERTSWFGVPVTVPVPVTVILPPAPDAVSTTGRDGDMVPAPPAVLVPELCPPALPRADCEEPMRNAPMSSAAVTIPIPIAR